MLLSKFSKRGMEANFEATRPQAVGVREKSCELASNPNARSQSQRSQRPRSGHRSHRIEQPNGHRTPISLFGSGHSRTPINEMACFLRLTGCEQAHTPIDEPGGGRLIRVFAFSRPSSNRLRRGWHRTFADAARDLTGRGSRCSIGYDVA